MSIISFMPGTSASAPSRPKRLAEENLAAQKRSNWSDHSRRSRMASLSSFDHVKGSGSSTRERIQFTWLTLCMCMYSNPMVRVYTSCRRSSRRSRRTCVWEPAPRNPLKPGRAPTGNSRARSASDRPW